MSEGGLDRVGMYSMAGSSCAREGEQWCEQDAKRTCGEGGGHSVAAYREKFLDDLHLG